MRCPKCGSIDTFTQGEGIDFTSGKPVKVWFWFCNNCPAEWNEYR